MMESKHKAFIYVQLAGSLVLLILIAFISGLPITKYTGNLMFTR